MSIPRNMALKANGLREKLTLNSILAYTDTETVKLDLDSTPFKKVKDWALRTKKKFRLGGFLILKSSKNRYHVVFNRTVSWPENVGIVAWVCLMSHLKPLVKWFLLQCIKGSSTLRVSPKGEKPSPRIVCRYGKQDRQIRVFHQYRMKIKRIIGKLSTSPNAHARIHACKKLIHAY